MAKQIALIICLVAFLLSLAGCSCNHTWLEADCTRAKICSKCRITDGEPLGHSPGEWSETIDIGATTVSKTQTCTRCDELIASETTPLNTMIQDDLFLFTPKEFMERLSAITVQHLDDFTYEFVENTSGMIASVNCNKMQLIVQFFQANSTALTMDDLDSAKVWCVSLTATGESNADLRYCFFMACDPALNQDSAFDVDMDLSTAFLNSASTGEMFGYYQYNGLLYETTYFAEGVLLQNDSMTLINIYASDFR